MNPLDRKLLLRIALRLERAAKESFAEAIKGNPARADQARRTRDRELGDVSDLKEYVKSAEKNGAERPIVEHSGAFVMIPAEPDEVVIAGLCGTIARHLPADGPMITPDIGREAYAYLTKDAKHL